MRKLGLVFVLCGSMALGACSKAKDALDALNSADSIDTLVECFPDLYEKIDQLIVVAETWRATESPANAPNPPGLNATTSGGRIFVDYTIPGTSCRIDMEIRFFSPGGAEQSLTINQDSLSNMMDQAATELGMVLFPNLDPFMVGTWTYSDANGGSGSGAITGIIGGVANQNELERLITTESTPMGGRPADALGVISLVTNAGDLCTVELSTVPPTHVETDTPQSQNYPVGQVAITVFGPKATVSATITMDGTAIAVISTNAAPDSFNLNLDTYEVSYNGKI